MLPRLTVWDISEVIEGKIPTKQEAIIQILDWGIKRKFSK